MEQFNDPISEPASFQVPSQFQFYFDKMINDMRFVGMFAIITGVLTCLSIIGAVIGVPTVIIGLRIREAADQFSIFKLTNNAAALRSGFELQGKYFRIIKILIIIGIVITIIEIIAIILLFAYGASLFLSNPSFNAS